ncbi:hypothetical protein BC629DRAFT_1437520 [Irpex lacteus]|nr:hypothetical protein BC629DRAFT_1437520 [Irpex lacteus]
MLNMGTVSLGGLDHAVADVSNQTIHWPVCHVARDCAHLSSNVLPLAQSPDFVRIFLRRPILLKWTAEKVVELGFVTSLESVDTTGTFGVVFVRLARTGYESGVSMVVPMERVWMPFARAPQTDPSLLSWANRLPPFVFSSWYKRVFHDLFPPFDMSFIAKEGDDEGYQSSLGNLSDFDLPVEDSAPTHPTKRKRMGSIRSILNSPFRFRPPSLFSRKRLSPSSSLSGVTAPDMGILLSQSVEVHHPIPTRPISSSALVAQRAQLAGREGDKDASSF